VITFAVRNVFPIEKYGTPAGIEPAPPGLGTQNNEIDLCLEYKGFHCILLKNKTILVCYIFFQFPYILCFPVFSVTFWSQFGHIV